MNFVARQMPKEQMEIHTRDGSAAYLSDEAKLLNSFDFMNVEGDDGLLLPAGGLH